MNNETMSWKQASIAWGEGKEIEIYWKEKWVPLEAGTSTGDDRYFHIAFYKKREYRIKPQADRQATVTEEGKRFETSKGEGWMFVYDTHATSHGIYREIHIEDLLNSLHEENEALKNELSQVKEDREALKKRILPIDKQPTPAEKTDNTQNESPSRWKLKFQDVIERLERVEKKLEQYFPEVN